MFKSGDKVVVRIDIDNPNVSDFLGKEVTIDKDEGRGYYSIKEDDGRFVWPEHCFYEARKFIRGDFVRVRESGIVDIIDEEVEGGYRLINNSDKLYPTEMLAPASWDEYFQEHAIVENSNVVVLIKKNITYCKKLSKDSTDQSGWVQGYVEGQLEAYRVVLGMLEED